MPDMTPVGNTIIPPNPQAGLNTMSSLLGVRQQQQNLQTGQYAQETAQADAQQAQQKNAQLTAAQNLAINGAKSGKYTNPDGTLNRQKMADDISVLGPHAQAAATSLLSQANEVVHNQKTHQEMTAQQQGIMSNTFQSLAGKKDLSNTDITEAFDTLTDQFKDVPGFKRMALSMATHIPNKATPEQLQGLMAQWAAAGRGEPQQTPSTIDTGAQVQPGATDKYTGAFTPAGGAINKGIPPGFELTEDPLTHNKYLWNRQSGESRPLGQGAPTSKGGSSSSASNAPPQRQIGEAEAQSNQVNTNFQYHQANVKAASAANQQLDQIRNVTKILDEGVKTGQGAQAMSQAEQALSNIPGLSGLAGTESQAAKFDLLNKFLERIGADYGSLNSSPARTDAAAESLRSQIGSTGYNPSALRDVMKYTAAQYQAAKAKDIAEQGFLSKSGNGILNQDQFEKQWRNSYEPRVYQLANEPKEVAKAAIQKMDPADRATFMKKYAELKAMGAAPP